MRDKILGPKIYNYRLSKSGKTVYIDTLLGIDWYTDRFKNRGGYIVEKNYTQEVIRPLANYKEVERD